MESIVVTGGTGFIGSHFVESAVASDYDVIVLKRSTSDLKRLNKITPGYTVIDLDDDKFLDAFTKVKPNIIVHFATDYGRDGNLNRTYESNVLFPLSLLNIVPKEGFKSFININTFSTKKKGLDYLPEYHLTKRHFSEIGKYFAQKSKLYFKDIYLFHPYGPYDNPNKFIPTIISDLLSNTPKIALTAGVQKRDFIHIDDVASGILSLIKNFESETYYSQFDLGTGTSVSIKDLVLLLKKITNSNSQLNFGKLPTRENEILDAKANLAAFTKIGWQPKIEVVEGFRRIIDSYR